MDARCMNLNCLHVPYDQVQGDLDRYMDYGGSQKTRYQHRQRIDNIKNILDRLGIASNDRILDVGCGSGIYLTLMAERSKNVVGVELSKEGIERSQVIFDEMGLKDRIHILRGDAMNLPFQGGSFDVVLCTEVLEHLPDPSKGALEIQRVLKKGGMALISMPNLISIFWLFNRINAEAGRISGVTTDIDPHMKYPFWKIEGILRKAGFDVKAVRGTYMIPSDLLFRLFPRNKNIAKLVYALGRIEWKINIKPLNAFFFVLATKRDKMEGK